MVMGQSLGAYVTRLRQAKNLSQGELATRAGVKSSSSISRLEAGKSNPKRVGELLSKIARPLGVPTAMLLAYAGLTDNPDDRPPSNALISRTHDLQRVAEPPEMAGPLVGVLDALAQLPAPFDEEASALVCAVVARLADDRRRYWQRRVAEASRQILQNGVYVVADHAETPGERARILFELLEAELFGGLPSPPNGGTPS